MKKRDLEKKLKKQGWTLSRHGSNHDVWTNGVISEPVPRHNEINELLAKKILRKAILNPG
ncbi:MAG: type II toxin-antitoxin system HicA family toxin [Chlamydiia bacterium]|nr:type II toxin-antitoxin system HicA family toxin [Chlamydiia bacterium]